MSYLRKWWGGGAVRTTGLANPPIPQLNIPDLLKDFPNWHQLLRALAHNEVINYNIPQWYGSASADMLALVTNVLYYFGVQHINQHPHLLSLYYAIPDDMITKPGRYGGTRTITKAFFRTLFIFNQALHLLSSQSIETISTSLSRHTQTHARGANPLQLPNSSRLHADIAVLGIIYLYISRNPSRFPSLQADMRNYEQEAARSSGIDTYDNDKNFQTQYLDAAMPKDNYDPSYAANSATLLQLLAAPAVPAALPPGAGTIVSMQPMVGTPISDDPGQPLLGGKRPHRCNPGCCCFGCKGQ